MGSDEQQDAKVKDEDEAREESEAQVDWGQAVSYESLAVAPVPLRAVLLPPP